MTAQTIANGIILAVIELALLAGILAAIGWFVAQAISAADTLAKGLGMDVGELFGTILMGAIVAVLWVGVWHIRAWIPLAGAVTMSVPAVF